MADVKISQLPAASTPLAGTEQVPLVQSSTTKQISVNNLLTSANLGTPTSVNLANATNVPMAEASGVLAVAHGGTGTTTPSIVAGTNVTVSGTWPNQTISATDTTGVTSVNTGTGLTGGPITTSGTIALADTAVTAGSYTSANITVDAQGRITAAANGSGGGGGVTSVTGTAPVVSSGGTTPAISMAAANTSTDGYLTSTDWNTFNNKQPAGSYLTSGGALGTPSSGTATNLTGLPLSTGVTGTLPVANGGTGTTTPSLVAGANVTITGTWPNQTIASTGGGGGGGGTVTDVSVVSANGLAGTVANSTTTPAITLSTSVTGMVKGNGTALSAATAGTDYVAPGGALGTPSSGTATNLTGLPLSTGVTGTLPIANGGTGATTAGGALTALGAIGSATSSDGSIVVNQVGTNIDLSVSAASPASTLLTQVRNTTGATLAKGTVVYMSGATGQIATVSKALATSDATSAQTLGMITADLANNTNGYVTVIGLLENLDTSAYSDGAQLYLSGTTAGAVTTTKPAAPVHLVYVAVVEYAHPTQGKLFVKVQNGYELDEIHDVSISSPVTGQTLVYNSGTDLWSNSTVSLTAGVNGTLPIANGGTGATSANAAFNALVPSQTGNSGKFLTTDGTDTSWATNPAGTVTSVGGTGTVNGITLSGTVTSSGNLTLGGTLSGVDLTTQVTGTLPVTNGGTGVTTSTGSGSVVLSNSPTLVTPALGTPVSGNFSTGTFTWPTFNQNTSGTAAGLSATLAVASGGTGLTSPGTSGNVLTSNGTAWVSSAPAASGVSQAKATAIAMVFGF